MTDLSISLSNIQNTKTVHIEGIGDFTVRRMGAGEELDMSFKMRRLNQILSELEKFDFTKFDLSKKDDIKQVEKLEKRMTKLSDEIAEIKKFELATYKKCFTDENNGENVDLLLNTLTELERAELFKQIFGENKEIDRDEPVKPEADNEK